MNRKMDPYVGITGFMSREEVVAVLKHFPSSEETGRKLMVGVLVSDKTLSGLPNRLNGRYPKLNRIADIFIEHPDVINLVHFNTKEKDYKLIVSQMMEIAEWAGKNCHGFQLNLGWLNPTVIKEYREKYHNHLIVLQCGSVDDCRDLESQEERMIFNSLNYAEICDFLLIDFSRGEGKEMDYERVFRFLRRLKQSPSLSINMKFSIAGGLNPNPSNLHNLEPFLRVFPDTSIDIEGKVRDSSDCLDLERANSFINQIFDFYRKWGV